jgi:hypothetical protein
MISTDDEILAAIRAESWVSVLFPENTLLTLSSVYLQQQEQQPARAATRYLQLQFIVTHEQIRMMQDTMSAFCIHRLLLKETVTNLCIMHGAQTSDLHKLKAFAVGCGDSFIHISIYM